MKYTGKSELQVFFILFSYIRSCYCYTSSDAFLLISSSLCCPGDQWKSTFHSHCRVHRMHETFKMGILSKGNVILVL